jgi:glutaredoxin 3
MIRVYTASYCPWCKKAVELLVSEGFTFLSADVTNDEDTRTMLRTLSNCSTVPQVWVDDRFIGGFSDLERLRAEGTLKKTLGVEE